MNSAERETGLGRQQRACLFRDGLIIAMLSCFPMRRKNLASLRVNRQLVRTNECYVLAFSRTETKNRRPIEVSLPVEFTTWIDTYLAIYRLMLPGAHCHDGVWASNRGRAMGEQILYKMIWRRTQKAFGLPLSPRLFRHSLATTIALEDPTHVGVATTILAHGNSRTTDEHYNKARTVDATRRYHRTLSGLIERSSHFDRASQK